MRIKKRMHKYPPFLREILNDIDQQYADGKRKIITKCPYCQDDAKKFTIEISKERCCCCGSCGKKVNLKVFDQDIDEAMIHYERKPKIRLITKNDGRCRTIVLSLSSRMSPVDGDYVWRLNNGLVTLYLGESWET